MEATLQVNESIRGQAEILQHMFAYSTSMALKCAVELRIADIIHSHGGSPITMSQIVSGISGSSCPNISFLTRIMRLLVHKNIFSAHHPSDGGKTLYGLTPSSRWNDEMCVKVLKNCRKAIPENTGKLIIVDAVLEDNNNMFEETKMLLDLTMMTLGSGKERTEAEWKKLLKEGSFPRYSIIKIPSRKSIVEA